MQTPPMSLLREKKGTGHEWTCKYCGKKLHNLTVPVHIAGKKFLNYRKMMGVQSCTPQAGTVRLLAGHTHTSWSLLDQ